MFPTTIDLRLTSLCNWNCPYCFGCKNIVAMPYEKLVKLLFFFKESGVKRLVITGGEPTLYPQIHQLLAKAKELGFSIILSTNGTFFKEDKAYIDALLENIDWIGLPLDSWDCNESARIRQRDYKDIKNIISLIHYIQNSHPKVRIKIGSVVCQINKHTIIDLLEKIDFKPDSWKIYQLCQNRNNMEFYSKNSIPDCEFIDIMSQIKKRYTDIKVPIFGCMEKQRDGQYLFCEPDGSIMVIKDNSEICIGNFFNSDDCNNCFEFYSLSKVDYNVEKSYPD